MNIFFKKKKEKPDQNTDGIIAFMLHSSSGVTPEDDEDDDKVTYGMLHATSGIEDLVFTEDVRVTHTG